MHSQNPSTPSSCPASGSAAGLTILSTRNHCLRSSRWATCCGCGWPGSRALPGRPSWVARRAGQRLDAWPPRPPPSAKRTTSAAGGTGWRAGGRLMPPLRQSQERRCPRWAQLMWGHKPVRPWHVLAPRPQWPPGWWAPKRWSWPRRPLPRLTWMRVFSPLREASLRKGHQYQRCLFHAPPVWDLPPLCPPKALWPAPSAPRLPSDPLTLPRLDTLSTGAPPTSICASETHSETWIKRDSFTLLGSGPGSTTCWPCFQEKHSLLKTTLVLIPEVLPDHPLTCWQFEKSRFIHLISDSSTHSELLASNKLALDVIGASCFPECLLSSLPFLHSDFLWTLWAAWYFMCFMFILSCINPVLVLWFKHYGYSFFAQF